jgi:hypothetical protein
VRQHLADLLQYARHNLERRGCCRYLVNRSAYPGNRDPDCKTARNPSRPNVPTGGREPSGDSSRGISKRIKTAEYCIGHDGEMETSPRGKPNVFHLDFIFAAFSWESKRLSSIKARIKRSWSFTVLEKDYAAPSRERVSGEVPGQTPSANRHG